MTAKGYVASLTITPQNSGEKVSCDLVLNVRSPIGVSKVMPVIALDTASDFVVPAFLMPSTRALIAI